MEGQNVVFIALTDEGSKSLSATKDFVSDTGINWPVGYGAKDTFAALNVVGYPTKFVFDTEGKLIWQGHFGDITDVIQGAL